MNVFLPIGIVECYGVNYVPVTFQGVKLLSRRRVPEFACPVIASCDEANTRNINKSQGENSCVLIKTSFFTCETYLALYNGTSVCRTNR